MGQRVKSRVHNKNYLGQRIHFPEDVERFPHPYLATEEQNRVRLNDGFTHYMREESPLELPVSGGVGGSIIFALMLNGDIYWRYAGPGRGREEAALLSEYLLATSMSNSVSQFGYITNGRIINHGNAVNGRFYHVY